jgi:hypothetical protein
MLDAKLAKIQIIKKKKKTQTNKQQQQKTTSSSVLEFWKKSIILQEYISSQSSNFSLRMLQCKSLRKWNLLSKSPGITHVSSIEESHCFFKWPGLLFNHCSVIDRKSE